MAFLNEHHFKFGRLLSDGIQTLRKSDEEKILEYIRMSSDRYNFKNDQEKQYMMNVYKEINEWIQTLNTQASESTSSDTVTYSYLLQPMDSHKRKILYQHAGTVYPILMMKETIEDNLV